MSPESIIALGTAIAAVIAAVTGLVAALVGLRSSREVAETGKQVLEVHTLVNSAKDAANAREEKLIATLQEAGLKIPKDDSVASGV